MRTEEYAIPCDAFEGVTDDEFNEAVRRLYDPTDREMIEDAFHIEPPAKREQIRRQFDMGKMWAAPVDKPYLLANDDHYMAWLDGGAHLRITNKGREVYAHDFGWPERGNAKSARREAIGHALRAIADLCK